MRKPLCFVLMPFRQRRNPTTGELVDFDQIFEHLIRPAINAAGLEAYRADEHYHGGIFHKRMFELLTMCEYAVADLSHANPNVYYELGVRHARRPWSTVLMYQQDDVLPLDVAIDAALRYSVHMLYDSPARQRFKDQLTQCLAAAQNHETDSPVFQLVAGLQIPELEHRRVDAMLSSLDSGMEYVQRINAAKRSGIQALEMLARDLAEETKGDLDVAYPLLVAFRGLTAWTEMVELVEQMSPPLRQTLLVREQYALALGRLKRFDEAVEILEAIVKRRPSAETYGLLGGIYKRMWLQSKAEGRSAWSNGLLGLAAAAYRKGFEHDWRDPYPGINAVTLSAIQGASASDFSDLLHIVRYSLNQRLKSPQTEYWDYACQLELAVIQGDHATGEAALASALARLKEPFEAETTLRNLDLLRLLCVDRGDEDWLLQVKIELASRFALRPNPESASGPTINTNGSLY